MGVGKTGVGKVGVSNRWKWNGGVENEMDGECS